VTVLIFISRLPGYKAFERQALSGEDNMKSLSLSCVCVAGLLGVLAIPVGLAAQKPMRYTIKDLGFVGTNFDQPGQPFEISNNGWVSGGAGIGTAYGPPAHAVLWHGGSTIDVGKPGLGGNSIAYGVNEWGHAVGEAEDTSSDLSTTEDFCGFQFMGYSSTPAPCVPFIWKDDRMVPLKTLGGANGVAFWINSYGFIAGYAENKIEDSTCPAGGSQVYQFKPVAWYGAWVLPLATAGKDADGAAFDDPDGVALAVNELGQVVGSTGTCSTFNPVSLLNLQPVHAVLWQNGKALDLGGLPGQSNYMAESINNRGEVVGGSSVEGFLWTREKGMQRLGYVGNDNFSTGIGINDDGEVVGVSANFSPDGAINAIRGFVRQNGKLVDLNTLVVGENPFPTGGLITNPLGNYPTGLLTACKINSKGEITGIAVDANGFTHAYVATPAN
jgi:probable HAF family extracellular repeat protein